MKIQIYKDKAKKYRWRFIANNNKIIAESGQGYKSKQSLFNTLHLICNNIIFSDIDLQ